MDLLSRRLVGAKINVRNSYSPPNVTWIGTQIFMVADPAFND